MSTVNIHYTNSTLCTYIYTYTHIDCDPAVVDLTVCVYVCIYTYRLTQSLTVNIYMQKRKWTDQHELIYQAAMTVMNRSEYGNRDRELQKVYVIGWLVDQLARDYPVNWDLKARLARILDK